VQFLFFFAIDTNNLVSQLIRSTIKKEVICAHDSILVERRIEMD